MTRAPATSCYTYTPRSAASGWSIVAEGRESAVKLGIDAESCRQSSRGAPVPTQPRAMATDLVATVGLNHETVRVVREHAAAPRFKTADLATE